MLFEGGWIEKIEGRTGLRGLSSRPAGGSFASLRPFG